MSISFKQSFQEAFKFYTESGTGDKLETALKNIGDFPPLGGDTRETFISSLLEIVLQHCLCVLNYFLFITYYKLTKMFTYLAHPHDTNTPTAHWYCVGGSGHSCTCFRILYAIYVGLEHKLCYEYSIKCKIMGWRLEDLLGIYWDFCWRNS
jgi:hypothetical protein